MATDVGELTRLSLRRRSANRVLRAALIRSPWLMRSLAEFYRAVIALLVAGGSFERTVTER